MVTPVSRSRIGERRLDPQSFGTICCDHMLVADYRDGEWTDVRIEPYGPLPLPPSISALQYGISVFEGHKAFQTVDGEVVLFRPYENWPACGGPAVGWYSRKCPRRSTSRASGS